MRLFSVRRVDDFWEDLDRLDGWINDMAGSDGTGFARVYNR